MSEYGKPIVLGAYGVHVSARPRLLQRQFHGRLELAGLRVMDRKFAVADIEIGAQELEVAGGNARANIRKRQQISERGDDRGALEPANVIGVADLAGRADAVGRS